MKVKTRRYNIIYSWNLKTVEEDLDNDSISYLKLCPVWYMFLLSTRELRRQIYIFKQSDYQCSVSYYYLIIRKGFSCLISRVKYDDYS